MEESGGAQLPPVVPAVVEVPEFQVTDGVSSRNLRPLINEILEALRQRAKSAIDGVVEDAIAEARGSAPPVPSVNAVVNPEAPCGRLAPLPIWHARAQYEEDEDAEADSVTAIVRQPSEDLDAPRLVQPVSATPDSSSTTLDSAGKMGKSSSTPTPRSPLAPSQQQQQTTKTSALKSPSPTSSKEPKELGLLPKNGVRKANSGPARAGLPSAKSPSNVKFCAQEEENSDDNDSFNSGVASWQNRDSAGEQDTFVLSARWRTEFERAQEEDEGPDGFISSSRNSAITRISLHAAQWGALQAAAAGKAEGQTEEKVLTNMKTDKFMINPFAKKRTAWDIAGIFLIAWDVIMLPLQVFNFEENVALTAVRYFGMGYWTGDIVLSFVTGQFDPKHNYIEMRPCRVATRYLTTWFVLDVFVVGLDWLIVLYADSADDSASLARAIKLLRLLRTLRLLRLVKLRRILHMFEKRATNEYMVACGNMGKLMVNMAVLNHIVACGWFGVGKLSGDAGWINVYGLVDAPSGLQYFTSLHWSFSNFQGNINVYPNTTLERAFCVLILYIGLVMVSYFISSITHFMTQIQQMHAEKTQRRWKLLRYLYDNNVSAELASHVKQFVDKVTMTQRTKGDEVDLLNILPERTQLALHCEIKSPALLVHPVIQNLVYDCEALGQRLCRDIEPVFMHYGEVLYRNEELCTSIYLMRSGRLRYITKKGTDGAGVTSKFNLGFSRTLSKMSFRTRDTLSGRRSIMSDNEAEGIEFAEGQTYMCEMALWTTWKHRGVITATCRSDVFSLDRQTFENLIPYMGNKVGKIALYAGRYIKWMNLQNPLHIDDLTKKPLEIATIESEEDDAAAAGGMVGFANFALARSIRASISNAPGLGGRSSVTSARTSTISSNSSGGANLMSRFRNNNNSKGRASVHSVVPSAVLEEVMESEESLTQSQESTGGSFVSPSASFFGHLAGPSSGGGGRLSSR